MSMASACGCKLQAWNSRIGKTKSTVKAGSWSTAKPPSRRSDNRTLFCQTPQEVPFEEPVKRYSWRDTLTVSLVSLKEEVCSANSPCFVRSFGRRSLARRCFHLRLRISSLLQCFWANCNPCRCVGPSGSMWQFLGFFRVKQRKPLVLQCFEAANIV